MPNVFYLKKESLIFSPKITMGDPAPLEPCDAFGLASARGCASWTELPRLSRPGTAEWTGPCDDLNSIVQSLRVICDRLAGDTDDHMTIASRKDLAQQLQGVASRVEAASEATLAGYGELQRANETRANNPEINGYGNLLSTAEAPEWATRDKTTTDQKRKQQAIASKKRAPPSREAVPANDPRRQPLTMDGVLAEKLPLRSERGDA